MKKEYICDICNRKIPNGPGLSRHIYKHQRDFMKASYRRLRNRRI